MSADDILWKNVEAMKSGRPTKSKHVLSRSESAVEPSLQPDTLYPPQPTEFGRSRENDESRSSTPVKAKAPTAKTEPPVRTTDPDHADVRTVVRTPLQDTRSLGQIPARPAQRQPERYSFQFWADQITRLKRLRQVLNIAKDPDDRTEITLSDMVRTAVDDYLDRETARISQTHDTS